MADKIAEIEVDLKINDRSYSQGAKRATDDTKALAEQAQSLSKELQTANTSAQTAGDGFAHLGKSAEKANTHIGKLKDHLGGMQSILGGIGAGLGLGGVMSLPGLFASTIGAAQNASAANAAAMSGFGIASGGNSELLAQMQDLYRKTNRGTTLSPQLSGSMSSQISRMFGWMPQSERESFTAKIARLGELPGENTMTLVESLSKISKAVGSEYGFGKHTMPDVLGQLAHTAAHSGSTITEAAASTAALTRAGQKEGITPEDAMNFLIGGYQLHGVGPVESAGMAMQELAKTRERTTVFNRDFRKEFPSALSQIYQSDAFRRYWPQKIPTMDIGPSALYATDSIREHRDFDLFMKNVGEDFGSLLDQLLTVTVGEERRKQASAWNSGKPIAPRIFSQNASSGPGLTVIQYFSSPSTPSVEVAAAQRQAAINAANINIW